MVLYSLECTILQEVSQILKYMRINAAKKKQKCTSLQVRYRNYKPLPIMWNQQICSREKFLLSCSILMNLEQEI